MLLTPHQDPNTKSLKPFFPYEETDDQLKAIDDILEDMAKDTPMDRLICGDVGFGNWEISIFCNRLRV